jgi:hypothetical protein
MADTPHGSTQIRSHATTKRAVLWLSALSFGAFGLAFGLWPQGMAATVGIVLPTDAARVDFVATYGGFELGFALFLALCARREAWVQPGLTASGCALAGFACLRAGAILLSADPGTLNYGVFAMEAAGSALSFWAARLGR